MTLILERPEILLAEQHGPSWHGPYSFTSFSAETIFYLGRKVLKNPIKSGQQKSAIVYYHSITEVENHVKLNEWRSKSAGYVQGKKLKIYPNHADPHKGIDT